MFSVPPCGSAWERSWVPNELPAPEATGHPYRDIADIELAIERHPSVSALVVLAAEFNGLLDQEAIASMAPEKVVRLGRFLRRIRDDVTRSLEMVKSLVSLATWIPSGAALVAAIAWAMSRPWALDVAFFILVPAVIVGRACARYRTDLILAERHLTEAIARIAAGCDSGRAGVLSSQNARIASNLEDADARLKKLEKKT